MEGDLGILMDSILQQVLITVTNSWTKTSTSYREEETRVEKAIPQEERE